MKIQPTEAKKAGLDIFLRYGGRACVLAAFTMGHLPLSWASEWR